MTTQKFPEGKQKEFSVLSMLIRHPKANIELALVYGLTIDCFYYEENRNMFSALLKLYNRKAYIDEASITDELNLMGSKITYQQIKELVSKKVEHSNALIGYIEELRDLDSQRKLIEKHKVAEELLLSEGTSYEKLEKIISEYSTVSVKQEEDRNFNEFDGFDSFIEFCKDNMKNKGKNTIKTEIPKYDAQVSFLPGVHILGGIPGSGKTALMQQIVNVNAKSGKNVFVFSIEMMFNMLMMRQVQATLGIEAWKINSGHITDEELNRIIAFKDQLSKNVTYNDLATIDISKLKSIARIANSKKKIDLICVDYLQKIKAKGFKVQHEMIEHIVEELSALGKEMNIPILCLAQLNREWKNNASGIPEASNIGGSKMIEQEAVSISFIHRPGHIDKTHPNPKQTFLYIAKNRFGNSNTVELEFDGATCSFKEKPPSIDDDVEVPENDNKGYVKKVPPPVKPKIKYKSYTNDD